jgi:tRNA dimethylallyltransferase
MGAPVWGLVGPTASGKTDASIELAQRLGAEIVCCDSMLVYRGLDVGTAKPTREQRARVQHHLLDLVEPAEEFSVERFQKQARLVLGQLAERGVPALVVGGSGLYVRAAIDPLQFPPTDPSLRRELERSDPEELRRELLAIDPFSAIEPGNVRRMIRALEVQRITGKPFSSFRSSWKSYAPVPLAGLCPRPGQHASVIAHRVQSMIHGGLLDEARQILDNEVSRTAAAAVGYSEATSVLLGLMTLEAAAAAMVLRTRELARRQRAWFRADPRVAWFGETSPPQIAAYFRSWCGLAGSERPHRAIGGRNVGSPQPAEAV